MNALQRFHFSFQTKVQDFALPGAANGGGSCDNLPLVESDLNRKSRDDRQNHAVLRAVHRRHHHSRRLGVPDHHSNGHALLCESQSAEEVPVIPARAHLLQAPTRLAEFDFEASHR